MEATVASQRAVYAETREKTMRYTVQLIDKYLLVQRDHRSGCLVRSVKEFDCLEMETSVACSQCPCA